MKRLPPSMTHSPPRRRRHRPRRPAKLGAVVALEPSRRAGAAGVRAGPRLGESVRADHAAARHRDEVAILLGLRAGEVERTAAERGVGRDDQPERAPHAADLLDRDRVGQGVHAGPALVLGNRDAEPAHLAESADDVDREAVLPLVLVDDRRDLLLHEVADRSTGAAGAPPERSRSIDPSVPARSLHGPAADTIRQRVSC